ncbi:MAG: UDP-glucose--hexose-1-phosphate uridylyltransferase [Streptococcaceae bacterium]|jgi:UDPglucose--hexose-1-phosphate uridylyltransferase|nr:UDP-glucose--hexose-1-phosphate uridylyltransferase [Streptococcaceae bacterium]
MDLVSRFSAFAMTSGVIEEIDRIWFENELRALIGRDDLDVVDLDELTVFSVVERLADVSECSGRLEALDWTRDMFETKLYGFLTPKPSVLQKEFESLSQIDSRQATDTFYRRCLENNQVKTREIAKNSHFNVPSRYGEMTITINLSKPEKNPREIAKLANLPKKATEDFPKCALCIENEGYLGRIDYPARSNHRVIRFDLEQEKWAMQYSPYAYFNEHSIFLNETHQNMVIDKGAFKKLLSIVQKLPHYFVGSNADLPIVGGSILNHEHFQGGRAAMPMENAAIRQSYSLAGGAITAHILEWPMSVIRLVGGSPNELVELSVKVLEAWNVYDNSDLEIVSHTGNVRHHTITPIARFRDGNYEMDLVLRDNHTTAEHPDGLFHPHKAHHHIKKENIGLIEVMGVAILPARLKRELAEIKNYLINGGALPTAIHQSWTATLKATYPRSNESIERFLELAVGEKFVAVLEDCGVFKTDAASQMAFQHFVRNTLPINEAK